MQERSEEMSQCPWGTQITHAQVVRTSRAEAGAGHRDHIHVGCSSVTLRAEFSLLTASSLLTTDVQAMQMQENE